MVSRAVRGFDVEIMLFSTLLLYSIHTLRACTGITGHRVTNTVHRVIANNTKWCVGMLKLEARFNFK
jgi:hypothetical protein